MGPISKIYKKEFIVSNNILFPTDVIIGEDMLFNIECAIKLHKYKIINQKFYYYRKYIGSVTNKFDKKIIESDINFHKRLKSLLESSKIEKSLKISMVSYSIKNAIIVLSNRLAYINTYKEAKEYFKIFEKEPYKLVLQQKDIFNKYSLKQKLILYCCIKKYYFIIYTFFKIRTKIKHKVKNTEYFVEI